VSLKDTLNSAHSHWMDAGGPESDIVVSSRVRVARNLAGMPFPHLMSAEKAGEVIQAVKLAVEKADAGEIGGGLELMPLSELSPLERQILVDKHLISPDHLLNNCQNKAVVLRDDEVVSIMVNEEDHLRIQCLMPGLSLREAWEVVNRVDDALEKTLDYAFSEKIGYLTSCPTNTGTGMRASVMVHLLGLKLTRQLGGVLGAIGKLGFTVRGLYGEGTEALGDLFQVSNQITLGQSEEEIIDSLISVTVQILSQERAARAALYKNSPQLVEDRVFRAFGTLQNARILSSEEAMRLFSDLRLGIGLNIISGISVRKLNELMVEIQPAFLMRLAGREMPAAERDVFRAALIRKELGG